MKRPAPEVALAFGKQRQTGRVKRPATPVPTLPFVETAPLGTNSTNNNFGIGTLGTGTMSKIGKKPITIPKGVQIKMDNGLVSVKGPKGELKRFIHGDVNLNIENEVLRVIPKNTEDRATWGLASALIKNMIKGVTEGFETIMEFQGVGYKATVKGNDLELGLGFSHPVTVKAPEGITFKAEKNVIRIQGMNNELVGKTAAEIRSWRKPEPYKGSGIRYQGEIIKRKAGKKAVASG